MCCSQDQARNYKVFGRQSAGDSSLSQSDLPKGRSGKHLVSFVGHKI